MKLDKSQASYSSFVRWAQQAPLPAKLVASTPEGKKTLAVDHSQARPWGRLHKILVAAYASDCEAQNEKGEALRRCEFAIPEEEDASEDVSTAPLLPLPENGDARMLVLFGQLLAHAYNDGAKQQREASSEAFRMLVALTESTMKRLDALERAWSRAMNLRADLGGDAPSGGAAQGDLMGLLGQLAQGFAMAQAQKAGMNGVASAVQQAAAEAVGDDGEGDGEEHEGEAS